MRGLRGRSSAGGGMAGRFVISRATDGQVYFNLKAGNNETILTSERYQSRAGADRGIVSVRTNAPLDGRYLRNNPAPGRWYFVLRAGNQEPIGTSESYASEAGMEKGIASVKANAPDAAVSHLARP